MNDDAAEDLELKTWDHVFEWRHLKTTGVLWLVNRAVFHPRGFALGVVPGADHSGEYYGWTMQGDGTEPWYFPPDVEDRHFGDVEAFFDAIRARGTKTVARELKEAERDGLALILPPPGRPV